MTMKRFTKPHLTMRWSWYALTGRYCYLAPPRTVQSWAECVRRAVCNAAMLMHDVDEHLPATKVNQAKTPRADSCTGPAGRTVVAPDATPAESTTSTTWHRGACPTAKSNRCGGHYWSISDTRCDETAGGLGLLFPRV